MNNSNQTEYILPHLRIQDARRNIKKLNKKIKNSRRRFHFDRSILFFYKQEICYYKNLIWNTHCKMNDLCRCCGQGNCKGVSNYRKCPNMVSDFEFSKDVCHCCEQRNCTGVGDRTLCPDYYTYECDEDNSSEIEYDPGDESDLVKLDAYLNRE